VNVKPKKHLGQHFLRNEEICLRIAQSLTRHGGYTQLLEIGPGTGALSKFLLELPDMDVSVIEVDEESIAYLNAYFPKLRGKILNHDFLQLPLHEKFEGQIAIIGNFPYNISSQILFKVLDHKEQVPEVVGMFQKEVAVRIASGPGNRDYGILSVLCQAYYDIDYLFSVDENEFIPPPKVKSGVIRLRRRESLELGCDPKRFKLVIKTAFNQRRKTLRNSLKSLSQGQVDMSGPIFDKRPEQLSVAQFVELTHIFTPNNPA
jgi:16S rRNA (adenine1518-N6/adenine1519-N6)-dimethyltransferase